MKTRHIMTYRTSVERVTRTSDGGGGFTDTWNVVVSNLPCYAWYVAGVEIAAAYGIEVIDTRVVLVPLATDVHAGDRFSSVNDRKGTVLFGGPLMVDNVGERIDHMMVTTRRIV